MTNDAQTELNKQDIAELKEDIKSIEKRVLAIEISREKTDYQYEQIMKAIDELNNKTIPNLMTEINELKNKPVKRYDQVITGLIGALVGAIGGAIASLFIK